MRERLGDRLPIFSKEDKDLLKNSLDFVGLNHYTSRFIAHVKDSPEEGDFYKAQEMERIGDFSNYINFHKETLLLSLSKCCLFNFIHQINGKEVRLLVRRYELIHLQTSQFL